METSYEKKNDTVQKASANTAESVVDSSSQGSALQRHANLTGRKVCQLFSKISYETQTVSYSDCSGQKCRDVVGKRAYAELDPKDPLAGSAPASNVHKKLMDSIRSKQSGKYVRGHLMNDHLGGIGTWYNLFPISSSANHEHLLTAEAVAKNFFRKGNIVHYEVVATPENAENVDYNPMVTFNCSVKWYSPSQIFPANQGEYIAKILSGKNGIGGCIEEYRNFNENIDSSWARNDKLKAFGKGESNGSKQSREQSSVVLEGRNYNANDALLKSLYRDEVDFYSYMDSFRDVLDDFLEYYEPLNDVELNMLNLVTNYNELQNLDYLLAKNRGCQTSLSYYGMQSV